MVVLGRVQASSNAGEQARLTGKQIVLAELAGFRGVFWRSDELAFALIADLPRDHLLDLAARLIQAVSAPPVKRTAP